MATATPTATRAEPAGATATRTEKGISLARGPALILGTILLAAGLYFMYKAHTYPKFSNLPNGSAPRDGNFFFGIFGANGWTGMLTAVGGGLLLFGAAQHLMAKTMSLIVGGCLLAAAIIAAISGNVLGMAAANGWTELGWAVCGVILLFNSLIPRRRHEVVVADEGAAGMGGGMMTRRRMRRREREAAAAGAAGGVAAGAHMERNRGTATAGDEGMMADDRTTTMSNREGMMADDRTMANREGMMNREGTMTNREGMGADGEPLVTRVEDDETRRA